MKAIFFILILSTVSHSIFYGQDILTVLPYDAENDFVRITDKQKESIKSNVVLKINNCGGMEQHDKDTFIAEVNNRLIKLNYVREFYKFIDFVANSVTIPELCRKDLVRDLSETKLFLSVRFNGDGDVGFNIFDKDQGDAFYPKLSVALSIPITTDNKIPEPKNLWAKFSNNTFLIFDIITRISAQKEQITDTNTAVTKLLNYGDDFYLKTGLRSGYKFNDFFYSTLSGYVGIISNKDKVIAGVTQKGSDMLLLNLNFGLSLSKYIIGGISFDYRNTISDKSAFLGNTLNNSTALNIFFIVNFPQYIQLYANVLAGSNLNRDKNRIFNLKIGYFLSTN